MQKLRHALEDVGFGQVRAQLQGGNVVLATDVVPESAADAVNPLVAARFGLDVGVVVRTSEELPEVVHRDPHGAVATDPERSRVRSLEAEPDAGAVRELEAAALAGERLVHLGRALNTRHPERIGRFRLARLLAGKRLGVTATTGIRPTAGALLALATEWAVLR